jgi:hypothetical protein
MTRKDQPRENSKNAEKKPLFVFFAFFCGHSILSVPVAAVGGFPPRVNRFLILQETT